MWGQFSEEADTRRIFLDEARRRVLSLLQDLHDWTQRHLRPPPPWTFERVAALADQVVANDVTTSELADTLEGVESEISNALVELAAVLEVDQPIPFNVTRPSPLEPLPAPRALRPFLLVIRGGRA